MFDFNKNSLNGLFIVILFKQSLHKTEHPPPQQQFHQN